MNLFPDLPTSEEIEADKREREEDLTPRAVARACVDSILSEYASPRLVLDVCAGHGVWSSEIRQATKRMKWGSTHICGVELDGSKQDDLAKWCDQVVIGDWRRALQSDLGNHHFTLAVGNPPFSHLVSDDPDQSMPAILLRRADVVALYHTQQAFLRGLPGRRIWRRYPPSHQYLIPGSVGHRGPRTSSDARCYAVSVWVASDLPALREDDGWLPEVELLPEIKPRTWRIPPGSEDPRSGIYEAQPGWAP